jgi:hypothetical protein
MRGAQPWQVSPSSETELRSPTSSLPRLSNTPPVSGGMGGPRRPLGLLMERHSAIGVVRASALDWIGVLFAAAALVLVPWVVFLVRALPSHHHSAHWDVAWGGFDIALVFLLVGVAVAAWLRSPWLEGAATAAATLLFVDAWFDVLTASSRSELVIAIVEAVVVELPIAVFCLLLARSVERRLAAAELAAEDCA